VKRTVLLRAVLLALLAVLAVRLSVWAVHFGLDSVQQDFASYYVAGQAVARGLSPYDNHVGADPPLWDGVAVHRHSRFLYPPIVAWTFRPFSWMPYAVAKIVWMGVALAALAIALWRAARAVGLRLDAARIAALAAIALAYFPVLPLLERGQIDTVTLALLMIAVGMMVRGRRPLLCGLLLALATAIKLHGLFLLPFLVARRQWRVVSGFAAGVAGILAVSLLAHGSAPLARYATEELPRISRYGDRGPADSRLDPGLLRPLLGDAAPGHTTVQGKTYAVETLSFEINASVVRTPLGRTVWHGVRDLGIPIAPAQVSLIFLAVGATVLLAWQLRNGVPRDRLGDLAYWCAVLTLVLLCAPLTWAMATTWMLPVAVVLLKGFEERRTRGLVTALGLCATGLVLAGMPDGLLDGLPVLPSFKYVGAEVLCLVGLLGLWRARAREEQ
jgi:hypothetical protein